MARLVGITETEGGVVLAVRDQGGTVHSYPCLASELLDWYREMDNPAKCERLLRERYLQLDILDGTIVGISTSAIPSSIWTGSVERRANADAARQPTPLTQSEAKVKRRQIVETHRQSSERVQELKAERQAEMQEAADKKARRDTKRGTSFAGGVRYCPTCGTTVASRGFFEAGRKVFYCGECGLPIGKA